MGDDKERYYMSEIVCEEACSNNGCNTVLIDWENKNKFVSLTYKIRLSDEGLGNIVFNTSLLTLFTIGIQNSTTGSIIGYLEVSPDKCHYKIDPGNIVVIEEGELELLVGRIFLKYTAIKVEGNPNEIVYVYFQGQC